MVVIEGGDMYVVSTAPPTRRTYCMYISSMMRCVSMAHSDVLFATLCWCREKERHWSWGMHTRAWPWLPEIPDMSEIHLNIRRPIGSSWSDHDRSSLLPVHYMTNDIQQSWNSADSDAVPKSFIWSHVSGLMTTVSLILAFVPQLAANLSSVTVSAGRQSDWQSFFTENNCLTAKSSMLIQLA